MTEAEIRALTAQAARWSTRNAELRSALQAICGARSATAGELREMASIALAVDNRAIAQAKSGRR